jgi:hypothetical protein
MEAITSAAVAAGIPSGAVRFMLSLFLAPLLCAVHGALRGAALRHCVSVALGGAMCVFAFGVAGTLGLAPPVLAAWAVMAAHPRGAGPLVFLLAFGYLIWWCGRRHRGAKTNPRECGRAMRQPPHTGPTHARCRRRRARRSHVATASGDAWKQGEIDFTGACSSATYAPFAIRFSPFSPPLQTTSRRHADGRHAQAGLHRV